MIGGGSPLAIKRQAELLGISRSAVYYRHAPMPASSLALMAEIDKIRLELPFFGARRIKNELNDRGLDVGRARVATLVAIAAAVAAAVLPCCWF